MQWNNGGNVCLEESNTDSVVPRRSPGPPSEPNIVSYGGTNACTDAQLREAGYRPPPPLLPPQKDPIPEKRTVNESETVNFTPKITIRCLEPPPIVMSVSIF